MQCDLIFPTPIWKSFEDIDILTIQDFCTDLKNKSQGRIMTNIGGWQSDEFDHNQIFESPLQALGEKILDNMKLISNDMGYHNIEWEIVSLWININGPGGRNSPHTHPGCAFSGCFYVSVPDNSGDIVFYRDSTEIHLMTYWGDATTFTDPTELSKVTTGYHPTEGMMLIFPSHITHLVQENQSNDNRISIAFNILGIPPIRKKLRTMGIK